jgi:hypothetical protein
MRLKVAAAAIAIAGTLTLMAAPANAQSSERRVGASGHTVFKSRGEDGRTRTRVIIQKRSYLHPGTETSPGESEHNYATGLTGGGTSVLDNTAFGGSQSVLPRNFDLGARGPVIRF